MVRFSFCPNRRREPLNLGDLHRRQAGEQILPVVEWIETVPPTTAQPVVIHRALGYIACGTCVHFRKSLR
jgi:hypothetical protein